MRCEICGEVIRGRAYTITTDRATLIVCGRCASRFRGEVAEYVPARRRASFTPRPRPKPRLTPPEPEYDIIDDFPERIREAREAMGLTRELLARMVGEKESTIRRIETGSLIPSLSLARKLERALKIILVEEVAASVRESGAEPSRFELTLGDIAELKRRDEEKE